MQVVAECKELYTSSLMDGKLPKLGPVFSKLASLSKPKQSKKVKA
jgi:hypothetical protein